ncbi:hypothetical protein SAMN02745132_02763 [Enterovibrio nigricans DSM 22720]|uniref:DNA-binding winged helix-turn-helix (WHTH) domain-containing protein n=2 Tax=Enterovibrio nigricans TaxID=504469 RepID=A0A1T4UXS4_9GAMM|nr:hypothetical protein [Enterovibrio nigricans]SKA57445.1 hypothetical protein SAMN02745132_02763 [Enterovibrio nigricans DSM 22720]
MVTKVNSRCYRFSDVDFEPESRTLYWRDCSVTTLTYEECRLLEMLCYHAGQVLSARVLYTSTSLPDTTFTQHQNSLCALLAKSYRQGEKVLPLDVVGDHGYRVALPQKTYQREVEPVPEPSEPDALDLTLNLPDIPAEPPKNKKAIGISIVCVSLVSTAVAAFLLF